VCPPAKPGVRRIYPTAGHYQSDTQVTDTGSPSVSLHLLITTVATAASTRRQPGEHCRPSVYVRQGRCHRLTLILDNVSHCVLNRPAVFQPDIAAKGDQVCQNATLHPRRAVRQSHRGTRWLAREITRLTPGACLACVKMSKLRTPGRRLVLEAARIATCSRRRSEIFHGLSPHAHLTLTLTFRARGAWCAPGSARFSCGTIARLARARTVHCARSVKRKDGRLDATACANPFTYVLARGCLPIACYWTLKRRT
jgi:hypothetical protein